MKKDKTGLEAIKIAQKYSLKLTEQQFEHRLRNERLVEWYQHTKGNICQQIFNRIKQEHDLAVSQLEEYQQLRKDNLKQYHSYLMIQLQQRHASVQVMFTLINHFY